VSFGGKKKSSNETKVFKATNRVANYIAHAGSQQPILFSYLQWKSWPVWPTLWKCTSL